MPAEQFLQSLHHSLSQAIDIRDSLACFISTGLIIERPDIETNIQDLDTYINSNRRIAMQCVELYSPGPHQIANESINNISGIN